jgi:lysozyme family protein
MADYNKCIDWVLRLEDSTLKGEVTKDADGITRFGLLNTWNPELASQNFYTCDSCTALSIAKVTYRRRYWDKFRGDDITADMVAAEVLSFDVNDGTEAIILVQHCLELTADGVVGPITLAAINVQDPQTFVYKLETAQIAYYQDIVARNPAKAKYLDGWINRAKATFHE